MLKETINFTDFNDQPATTVEYFNLSKNEIIALEDSVEGGLTALLHQVEDNGTVQSVLDLLKLLAHASYGIKSPDGKYFEKSPEITRRFISSAFYDDFLFSLLENDAEKGLKFLKGIIPQSLLAEAERQIAANAASENYAPDARRAFGLAQEATPAPAVAQQPVQPAPVQQPAPTQADIDAEEFRKWQAERAAQATPVQASPPGNPNVFRVPAEETPLQGFQQ